MHRVDQELDLNYKRQALNDNCVFSTKNKYKVNILTRLYEASEN